MLLLIYLPHNMPGDDARCTTDVTAAARTTQTHTCPARAHLTPRHPRNCVASNNPLWRTYVAGSNALHPHPTRSLSCSVLSSPYPSILPCHDSRQTLPYSGLAGTGAGRKGAGGKGWKVRVREGRVGRYVRDPGPSEPMPRPPPTVKPTARPMPQPSAPQTPAHPTDRHPKRAIHCIFDLCCW